VTDRLPQALLPATDPPGEAGGAAAPPWQRYRAAPPPPGRALLALVLADAGAGPEGEAFLAGLPVAVTVAVDPFDPDAPRRAAAYRAAGHEVALRLDGIAAGLGASDIEVILSVWAQELPEALGVVQAPPGDPRQARALAPVLIPALAARGLALIAPDRGLSPLLAAARAAGVPAAGLYRALDGGDEAAPAVRRLLDRAAFEAGRTGRAAVWGRLDRAETRAALAEWLARPPNRPVAPVGAGALLAVR
jgi:polysaccharide deacetylase 2 family uncharacterized protein YibQ